MNNNKFKIGYIPRQDKPIQVENYVPEVVKRLLEKINFSNFENIVLFGFSTNMKWILRLLKINGITPKLSDWRSKFRNYDCGGDKIVNLEKLTKNESTLIILCPDDVEDLKSAMIYLMQDKFSKIPVIYDLQEHYNPILQQSPYKDIFKKAKIRATSMLRNEQLFDLIQFIEITK